MKQSKKRDITKKTPYEHFNMTQQEVADALGVPRPYISTIEARAKARFKEEMAKRGYKAEDFIGGMA